MRDRPIWVFDEFEVDLGAWRLSRAGLPVPLEPKALALLGLLIERQGEVVTKGEILTKVWKDAAVTENAMVRVIAQIRGALGDDPKTPTYLETVHTRGYRFIAPVRRSVVAAPDTPGSPAPPSRQGSATERPPASRVETGDTESRAPEARPRSPSPGRIAIAGVVTAALAAAVLYGWNAWRGPAPAPAHAPALVTTASIAILPLENLGPPAHQYFADGMTEALTTQLAKIGALKVISRSAVMRYRAERPAPSTIARELAVANLVEGSALLAGDRVRVTARLVDGRSDRTIWNESYEGDVRDVLALQARIAREIAREIRVRVTADEENRIASARAVSPAAYQEYLKGLYEHERGLTIDADMFLHRRQAVEGFRAAVGLEPTWGEAHGALAEAHLRLASMLDNHAERLQHYRLARESATRAVDLDPTVVRARLALARARFFLEGDWEGTEREHLEVLRLEPNNSDWTYGVFLTYAGRFDEALARLRYSLERWPTSASIRYQLGLACVCARRYDEAAKVAAEMRSRLGDEVHASLIDAMVLDGRGKYGEAVGLLESNREALLVNRATTFFQVLGHAAARAGQTDRAREALRVLEASGSLRGSILFALGDVAGAVREAEERYRTRDYTLMQVRCWSEFENVRKIPRFAQILRDTGLPGFH